MNKTTMNASHAHSGFVVHRGRVIPTLASLQEPVAAVRYRQSKERSNLDLRDDRGNFILIFDLILDYFIV